MSNTKHGSARLLRHTGPYFPPAIDELNTALDARSFSGVTIEQIAANLPGYRSTSQGVTTSDGYDWYRVVTFGDDVSGEVLVAFPWHQDFKGGRAGGSQRDRSAAVYTRNVDIDSSHINDTVASLVAALLAWEPEPAEEPAA